MLLRLTQHADTPPDWFRVEASLEDNGQRQTVTSRFQFALSAQDREDLRWYLEDYGQNPFDPAPAIAARVEARMAKIGDLLFRAVFESSETARRLWARLSDRLDATRIEVVTEIREATAIPWELLRDPLTAEPLALAAQAFVRSQTDVARPARPSDRSPLEDGENKIRILLVICRPRGRDDVPFRSVASRILRSLSREARDIVQLDVLRPPSFEELAKTLRAAKRAGQPYHVLHFDGHGAYMDLPEPSKIADFLKRLGMTTLGAPRAGQHGYLLFENPQADEKASLVDGPTLGKLLVETGVPVLVLNACQSAFAEAPEQPADASASPQQQVAAFGSLAQEVMATGVAGVVAMRYVLYVETAKRFVADLYDALLLGDTLAEAVTYGRKQLASNPQREIGDRPVNLQDWPVPIVYEAGPIALFPPAAPGAQAAPLRLTVDSQERATLEGVPPPPDVGFFGRDATLLALDRAFDTQSAVLLHAYAGSGKTATAAEFARWYLATGGIDGPVLWTSFERYQPLPRVLDAIGRVFGPLLEQNNIHWLALDDAQRRQLSLQIMRQIPILWIWDNVEPVTGFPAGSQSAWSAAEQAELADFLRAARETQAKFLLTSRRDERAWLGDLPRRVVLPPMPMQERIQLARALAERHGRTLADVEDWRPLLRYTEGNPLTLTVVVGQALRDGLSKKAEIGAYVARLRAGQAVFDDEAAEGRSKSLGASLSYGFASTFTEVERKQLALLHFFQGFVDVNALRIMGGDPTMMEEPTDWSLPELRNLTREIGIALLDRAAEIGLLTAHGGGYYSIHPVLPWYFKSLFDQYYPPTSADPSLSAIHHSSLLTPGSPARAFVEAMGELGNYYHNQYGAGNREVIAALEAEEANLLHARSLARAYAWWDALIGTMQGLRKLCDHTGRRSEWAAMVAQITPDFVDLATDDPLPGREEQWGLVTEYRVRLAMEARRWAEAERLQRVCVEWKRRRAALTLATPLDALDAAERDAIRTLAGSLVHLAIILRELSNPECVQPFEEAINLDHQVGDRPKEAISAFNLGDAYRDIPALRDLAHAEHWYRRSLELHDERDRLGRSKVLHQLGTVAQERFYDAREASRPKKELLRHLNDAVEFYHQALDLTPPSAADDLAVTHSMLGSIYGAAGDLDSALTHYRQAIRYLEAAGNSFVAAQTRFNIAVDLLNGSRFPDALAYAQAALRNYETYGDRAAADIQRTQGLIAKIKRDRRGGE